MIDINADNVLERSELKELFRLVMPDMSTLQMRYLMSHFQKIDGNGVSWSCMVHNRLACCSYAQWRSHVHYSSILLHAWHCCCSGAWQLHACTFAACACNT
jgi:hypothetical protein